MPRGISGAFIILILFMVCTPYSGRTDVGSSSESEILVTADPEDVRFDEAGAPSQLPSKILKPQEIPTPSIHAENLMKSVAGVSVSSSGSPGTLAQVSLRGLPSQQTL